MPVLTRNIERRGPASFQQAADLGLTSNANSVARMISRAQARPFRVAAENNLMNQAFAVSQLISSRAGQMQAAKIRSGARQLAKVAQIASNREIRSNAQRAKRTMIAEAKRAKQEQRRYEMEMRRQERARVKLNKQANKCQEKAQKMRDNLANKLGEVTTLQNKIRNCESVIAEANQIV
jgi:chromosome segregation ATPase